jgi:hypothetical protein
MPAFLLQPRLDVKAVQAVLFFVLAATSRGSRSLRLLLTALTLLGSTVLFNLITPVGRVLVEVGPIVVTHGALTGGLFKGLTLVGLMLLSRFAVRRSVTLPGRLGLYISTTLLYLNRLLDAGPEMRGGGLLGRLDGMLLSVYRKSPPRPEPVQRRPRPFGLTVLAALVAANWGLLFFAT